MLGCAFQQREAEERLNHQQLGTTVVIKDDGGWGVVDWGPKSGKFRKRRCDMRPGKAETKV